LGWEISLRKTQDWEIDLPQELEVPSESIEQHSQMKRPKPSNWQILWRTQMQTAIQIQTVNKTRTGTLREIARGNWTSRGSH